MVNIALALEIAGPLIALILIIVGAVKAWPFRKTDKQKFAEIYKPYKWCGIAVFVLLNLVGYLLLLAH